MMKKAEKNEAMENLMRLTGISPSEWALAFMSDNLVTAASGDPEEPAGGWADGDDCNCMHCEIEGHRQAEMWA